MSSHNTPPPRSRKSNEQSTPTCLESPNCTASDDEVAFDSRTRTAMTGMGSPPDPRRIGIIISERLDPPRMRREIVRDFILRTLDHPCVQVLGLCVALSILASGAAFFFPAIGAHWLCRPRFNCEPRNRVVNISMHMINGGISYISAVSFPWRAANLFNLTGLSPRPCGVGRNLYGQPCCEHDIWFHIPTTTRLKITLLLILQCLLHSTNQVMRGIYWSYERSQSMPGAVLTKVFMISSFGCSIAAAIWTAIESKKLRRMAPKQFSTGKLTLWSAAKETEVDDSSVGDSTREQKRRAVLLENDRGSMRLFAM